MHAHGGFTFKRFPAAPLATPGLWMFIHVFSGYLWVYLRADPKNQFYAQAFTCDNTTNEATIISGLSNGGTTQIPSCKMQAERREEV